MIKVMAFLTKRDGINTRDLIEYYENQHVPLITRLAPIPSVYKRNYILRKDDSSTTDDFDIVTELVFPDHGAYEAWVAKMYAPHSGVAEDELNFLDRSRTRSYIVEEHVTSE
ncbi:EthD domain-containing protein [Paenibacillus terrigena]|uniref:EthD domain-containing protein n=1 Tax=Paenibacillus terrigena TaxID=369333 RepID=UPI0028D6C5E2|nr:EthD domain-containing protein [Paenibacillus terrigena]